MKTVLVFFFGLFLGGVIVFALGRYEPVNKPLLNPFASPNPTAKPKPLLKYSFSALKQTSIPSGEIIIGDLIDETPEYRTHTFSYQSEGKTITGLTHIPQSSVPPGGFPVIVMLRGFVDPSIYKPGVGTSPAARKYVSAGFVTFAPDFLGFGGSDSPNPNSIGARVERPYNVISLLNSLPSVKNINPDKVFLWGHSNGGQIALSVLEITGLPIPTTLWAPVTKAFPYSILYYTDESPDQGKALRQVVADFESDYDVFDFSIDRYLDWINAPIQFHQGTNDDAIPLEWTSDTVNRLTTLDKDVSLYTYPGADHNLRPGWETVVSRDLNFYASYLAPGAYPTPATPSANINP